jgi:hypothetical protein
VRTATSGLREHRVATVVVYCEGIDEPAYTLATCSFRAQRGVDTLNCLGRVPRTLLETHPESPPKNCPFQFRQASCGI